MKTSTSFVLVALTFLSSFTEASNGKKDVTKKAGKRAAEPEIFAYGHDGRPFTHVLFQRGHVVMIEESATPFDNSHASISTGAAAAAVARESDGEDNDDDGRLKSISDDERLKSISDDESESLQSISEDEANAISFSSKRMRQEPTQPSEEQAAIDALMHMSNSGGTGINVDDQIRTSEESVQGQNEVGKVKKVRRTLIRKAPTVRKARVARKAAKELVKMKIGTFANGRCRNFSIYFDERNMQTDGNATLLECFNTSHFFELAAYLIRSGARLPEDADKLLDSFSVAICGAVESQVSAKILMELFKIDTADTIKTVQLFIEIAKLMNEEIVGRFDTFFMSLLMDPEVSVFFFPSPSAAEVIRLLSESGFFPETLNYICYNFNGELDGEIVSSVTVKAINSGHAALIEILLTKGLIRVDDKFRLAEGKQMLSLIANLFGKLAPETILNFITKFNYPLDYTHNSSINPHGDILLAAVTGNDLESFKILLRLGASVDVKMTLNSPTTRFISLEKMLSKKYAEFHEALTEFRSGALQSPLESGESNIVEDESI